MLSRQVATCRDLSRQLSLQKLLQLRNQFPHNKRQHPRPTWRDTPRQRPCLHYGNAGSAAEQRQEATTGHDTPRQVATEPAATGETSRYVAQLERQVEIARDERDFLREQINRKDSTIDALIERDKETNYLVRGLQEMLTPLLGGGRRHDPPTYTQ